MIKTKRTQLNFKLSRLALGRISELKATTKLLSLGYVIFEAIYPDSCDCIIRTELGLKQIQIKTLNPSGGVNLTNEKPYIKEEIDFFITVAQDNNDFWIVPFQDGNKFLNPSKLTKFLNNWALLPKPLQRK